MNSAPNRSRPRTKQSCCVVLLSIGFLRFPLRFISGQVPLPLPAPHARRPFQAFPSPQNAARRGRKTRSDGALRAARLLRFRVPPPHVLRAYGDPLSASGGVPWSNMTFFPRHIPILSRPFRRCQQTQGAPKRASVPAARTATRIVLSHIPHYFRPILPGTEKAPGLHALARGPVAGNRYHPATYPNGVDRSGIFPRSRQRQGEFSRTQSVLRRDPRTDLTRFGARGLRSPRRGSRDLSYSRAEVQRG